MGIKFANGAYATLASGINSSATSITLTSGQGARFPSLSGGDYFFATLIDTSNNLEIVKCTARSTDVLTVTRAQESTTARAFSAGDRIELRITAQGLLDAGAASLDGDRGDVTVSSSGTVWTIDNGAVTAAKLASTLDLTGKTVTLPAGVGGKVLQVVQTVMTSVGSYSGSAFNTITPLSTNITPSSASSKILIMPSIDYAITSGYRAGFRILRDGSTILLGDVGNSRTRTTQIGRFFDANNQMLCQANRIYLDSPSSTSAVTYSFQISAENQTGATIFINRTVTDSDDGTHYRGTSTVTFMEIAA